jgi:hypothetical protein
MNLTNIPDQTVPVNTFTDLILFQVSDTHSSAQLQVFASESSNPELVPLSDSNIQLGGTGPLRALIVRPAKDQTGSSVITMSVNLKTASSRVV